MRMQPPPAFYIPLLYFARALRQVTTFAAVGSARQDAFAQRRRQETFSRRIFRAYAIHFCTDMDTDTDLRQCRASPAEAESCEFVDALAAAGSVFAGAGFPLAVA